MTQQGIEVPSSLSRPRYAGMFVEGVETPAGTVVANDPYWSVSGDTTGSTYDAYWEAGIYASGTLPNPTAVASLNVAMFASAAGVVTAKPGIVLDPTTESLAPDTLGSLMYDSGSDELKYYDGSWQIVSAGGLSSHTLDGIYHSATGLTVGDVLSADSATTFSWKAQAGGTDDDAIHDNVANEITAITPKTALAATDEFVLEDSAASFVKKAVTFANIESSISLANLGVRTHASLSDAPADAHHVEFVSADAAALITTHANDDNAHHEVIEQSDVESIITTEIGPGESIDNAIDALILTHKQLPNDHHTPPVAGDFNHNDLANIDAGDINHLTDAQVTALHAAYTDGDVESVITFEIGPGESIDNAIDSLISTHASDDNAHHEVFESGDFTTAFAAESLANLATRAHSDLSDAPSDAHHPKVHALIDATNHPESGLTTGHFLKATGTTTYAFGAHGLTASDVGAAAALSGTQWTLPVFDTTTTIGNSMVSQDSGGTQAVIAGSLKVDGILYLYSTEGGKTEYRATINATDADNLRIYGFRDGFDFVDMIVGQSAALGLTVAGATGNVDIGGSLTVGSIVAESTDVDTFLVSNAGLVKFRTGTQVLSDIGGAATGEAHVLATSGPHSSALPLTDIASYAQGSLIIGGGVDWESLGAGTETYILKMGASEPSWSTVDWSELSGSQPAPISHDFDTHSGDVDLTDLAAGTQGGLIKVGASDWEELGKGANTTVLKSGASDISWGWVQWGELGGTQPAPVAHVLDSASHTITGKTGGHFLKADSATTYSFQAHGLGASDVGAYTTAQTDSAIDTDISTHNVANNHLDWTASVGTIHTDNYIEYTDAAVESVITAEIVDGQSIDNAIDALITTHNVANNHLDWTASVGTIHTDNYIEYTDAAVESVITAEIVDGQSIDAAIDALILTHKNISAAHHTKYTTVESEAVITAELVDGQSIDNAIDALILTHKNLAAAHHAKYTDGEVEAVITTELVNGQSIDNRIDTLIDAHADEEDVHHDGSLMIATHAAIDDAHHDAGSITSVKKDKVIYQMDEASWSNGEFIDAWTIQNGTWEDYASTGYLECNTSVYYPYGRDSASIHFHFTAGNITPQWRLYFPLLPASNVILRFRYYRTDSNTLRGHVFYFYGWFRTLSTNVYALRRIGQFEPFVDNELRWKTDIERDKITSIENDWLDLQIHCVGQKGASGVNAGQVRTSMAKSNDSTNAWVTSWSAWFDMEQTTGSEDYQFLGFSLISMTINNSSYTSNVYMDDFEIIVADATLAA